MNSPVAAGFVAAGFVVSRSVYGISARNSSEAKNLSDNGTDYSGFV